MQVAQEQEPLLGITDESGCWPTPNQELLLRAAILRGAPVLKAWKEWRDTADLDALDFGSHRMLPQVYRNLLDHRVSDPLLAKLRSVYRYYWYKNEMLLRQGAAIVNSLRNAHIEIMLLKGAALIPLYYRDAGLRPVQDFDFLVPVEQARITISMLEEAGWQSLSGSTEERLRVQHSTPYRNAEGQQLDLHWHVLGGCWNWTRDDGFWERSVVTTIGNQRVRALDPTDQLFHTCAHGIQWNEVPPIRWIADAMTIFREASGKINWDRLTRTASTHHLTLPVHDGLNYLQSTFHAPVPPGVLENLRRMPVTDIDRFGYRLMAEPLRQPATGEIFRRLGYECLQVTSAWPIWRKPQILAKWLQFKWNLESTRKLFSTLPYRAACHIGKRTAGRMKTTLIGWTANPSERKTVEGAVK